MALPAHEILLFWAVLAGLLFVDNCVLLPPGGDGLRFGRAWRLRYDAGTRLEVLRRELVVLNPLNPFDRLILTSRSVGPLSVDEFRGGTRRLRTGLAAANRLSMLGSAYLAMLVLLAAASLQVYFGVVLAALAVAHLLTWTASVVVLVQHRAKLELGGQRVFSLALEALLVPGYLVNLGKRIWFKRSLDLPALAIGLHRWRRLQDESERELQRLRLDRRLDELAQSLDADAHASFSEARKCLKTHA